MARWVTLLCALVALLSTGCPPPEPPKPPPVPTPVPPEPVTPPADPAPVTDGDVTVSYANGLRILVKRIPGAELASLQLYIKGGARFRSEANAGLEQLALTVAASGGTQRLNKQAFGKRLSALGSDIGASSRHSYSRIGAVSLTREFAATFALLAEVLLTPAMPASEIELQRARQIAGIKQREVTPDERLSFQVTQTFYADHPYQHLPDGTVKSVTSFGAATLAEHLASLRKTSRLQLVVVGDVDPARVRQLALEHFGKLTRGSYQATPLPKPAFAAPKLKVVADPALPTNYIEASFVAPSWSDPHFAASILTMRMLSRRLFDEVRTKRNLSYAPSARHSWGGDVSRGALYVTATDPDTTFNVMLAEARKLKTEKVGMKELTGAKSVFVTNQLMANESTSGQASWLALCDIIGGDWKLSRTLIERVKAVTPAQVQAFAEAHLHTLQTVVLGDPAKIDRALFESL